MSVNIFESVIIINASISDEDIENIINEIRNFLDSKNVYIIDTERWGRKNLAYSIDNAKLGYYFILRFKATKDFVNELERKFKLEENIIRYMTIHLSKEDFEQSQEKRNITKEKQITIIFDNKKTNSKLVVDFLVSLSALYKSIGGDGLKIKESYDLVGEHAYEKVIS